MGEGVLYNFVFTNCHSKRNTVTSLRFTEINNYSNDHRYVVIYIGLQFPLGKRRYYDVESTSLTLIQRRSNGVCPEENNAQVEMLICKRCSFECDMEKYSTRSMNKMWTFRRTPYSLIEHVLYFHISHEKWTTFVFSHTNKSNISNHA